MREPPNLSGCGNSLLSRETELVIVFHSYQSPKHGFPRHGINHPTCHGDDFSPTRRARVFALAGNLLVLRNVSVMFRLRYNRQIASSRHRSSLFFVELRA